MMMGLPINVLMAALESIINQAHAGVLDNPSNKYGVKLVQIIMPGGPPRWMFDLPLTPNGNDQFMAGSFGNALQADTTTNVVHSSFKSRNGLHVPPVWGMNLAGVSPFQSLLDNALFLRGVDGEIDNHDLNRVRADQPVLGGQSISGSIADISSNPIAAIDMLNRNSTFISKNNKAVSFVDSGVNGNTNPVSRAMQPFTQGGKVFYRAQPGWNAAIEQALDQLDLYAKNLNSAKSGLRENYAAADSLIKEGVTALTDRWTGVYNKYLGVIDAALNPTKGSLPGFFDKVIPVTAGDNRFRLSDTAMPNMTDLRDLTSRGLQRRGDAATFAAAEILLTSGAVSTVIMGWGGTNNIALSPGGNTMGLGHDQHTTGSAAMSLVMNLAYRSLIASMTTFMDASKAAGTWNKTIIQTGSEFNRNPRTDASGADHAPNASTVSIYSGMINGAACVGNVVTDPGNNNYRGTYGVSANFQIEGENRKLRFNDVARTITAMAGSPDIVTNGVSLMKPDGTGGWVPKLKVANNV